MFCPKCNDVLTKINEAAFCVRGEMYLSQSLTSRLEECYVAKIRRTRESKFSFQVGGKWFCPGCGVPTFEEDGLVCCTKCGLSINEFICELIERSPHDKYDALLS